ncbi:hypothetical protein SHIRM173S_03248 [Streptomyces hirsutus]
MSRYSTWAEVKRRLRESRPEVSDAEWESRKHAARAATGAYVAGPPLRVRSARNEGRRGNFPGQGPQTRAPGPGSR